MQRLEVPVQMTTPALGAMSPIIAAIDFSVYLFHELYV